MIERIREIIYASAFAEFPDALVTLKLSMAEAKLQKNDPNAALRHTARMLVPKAEDQRLRQALYDMSKDDEPVRQLVTLISVVNQMEEALLTRFAMMGYDAKKLNATPLEVLVTL